MGQEDVNVGPQVPQREFKGYSKTTEVAIPILQSLTVVVAVDALAGLLFYLLIYIGPNWLRFIVGMLTMLLTIILAFARPDDWRRSVLILIVGCIVLTGGQVWLLRLAEVWPREWITTQFWWPWIYTIWLGPVVGCGALIWRFVNEVRDPWWPRLARPPDEAMPQQPRMIVRETPVYIRRWNGQRPDKSRVLAPVPIEERQPIYTLGDDLRAFILESRKRGLERSNWIKPHQPRVKLWPSGRGVTRGYYDKLMAILHQANIISWDGRGSPTEMNCSLEEAIDCLEVYWEGGQAVGGQETDVDPPTAQ